MARPVLLMRIFIAILGLSALACAKDPWTYPAREQGSVGGEVFRVFCKRTVKESFPDDLEGHTFTPACLGEGEPPRTDERLAALLSRREKIVSTIDRILGDDTVMQREIVTVLDPDEI